jgi:uncharacterized iron-regulated protein
MHNKTAPIIALTLLALCSLSGIARADQAVGPDPLRIYALNEDQALFPSGITSWESFIADLAGADVVFLGEYHDDDASHRTQLRVLEALAPEREGHFALAMEQFERDVQTVLDSYLAGDISEEQFLADSRPWPNYPEHYKPLIEYCREQGIPVRAGNIPRRYASIVSKEGLDTLYTSITEEERPWIALATLNEQNAYYDNFIEAMGGHGSMPEDKMTMFYRAQCIKDDTMAESIAEIREADPEAQVLHINGSFHSDYGLGTAERLLARRADDKVLTVALRPVDSFVTLDPFSDRELADYIIYVPGPDFGKWKLETLAAEQAAVAEE